MKKIKEFLTENAKKLKKEILVIYLAAINPKTPFYAKYFALLIALYALSPIDLIPDFIPVLGYLDDLIIIPLGIYIALKMIPKEIIQESREKATKIIFDKEKNWYGVLIVFIIWIIIIYFLFRLI